MPEKRKKLSNIEFCKLYVEQGGLCGCGCGGMLVLEKFQVRDEHLNQLSMGGTNELKNRSLWRLPCTKAKDAKDSKVRAKVRSLTGANKPKRKAKIQGRKEIPKRQFEKAKNSGFNRGYKSKIRIEEVYD